MYRTWLYFVGMTVIIMLIFWVSEVIFFHTLYRRTQEETLDRSAKTVVNSFNGTLSPAYKTVVTNTALQNSMVVMLFKTREDIPLDTAVSEDVILLLYQDPVNRVPSKDEVVILDEQYLLNMKSGKEFFSYRNRNVQPDSYVYVVGAKTVIGGETVYFYMATALAPVNRALVPFTNQFIIVTCICIMLSVIIALGFSLRLTRPITAFARTARLLAKGQEVEFKMSGIDEYDQLAKALNYSTEELNKTEKMRRDFLANISHDLRTPLTMVKAYAEMIRDISGDVPKKRNEHCKVIIDEVDRLTLLVNDLLDLSKIQAGTRKPDLKPINLSALVKTVMERFSMYEERDGYSFEVICDENCVILADERMVEQICYNLIGNAVSYTGEDKKVGVSVKREDGVIAVRISDTGRGISPSEKDKVWDRYYRASQSKRAVVGSGIGLSIVKSLLQAHSAEYGIDSVVNHGTTFWFKMKEVASEENEQ